MRQKRGVKGSRNVSRCLGLRKRNSKSNLRPPSWKWSEQRSLCTRCSRKVSKWSCKSKKGPVRRFLIRFTFHVAQSISTNWMSMRWSTISIWCKCNSKEIQTKIDHSCPLRQASHQSTAVNSTNATVSKSRRGLRWRKQNKNSSNCSLRKRRATVVLWRMSISHTSASWSPRNSKISKIKLSILSGRASTFRRGLDCLCFRKRCRLTLSNSS